jgi:hypothetical protein
MTNLYAFQGYTLVDITATGVIRSQDQDSIERNQQRNWETVIQCMGLRTQPQHITVPYATDDFDLALFRFGEFYSGKQRVWTWKWTVEPAGVYDLPNEPLGGLYKDFEQVPVVTGLTETARFMLPIFYPYGAIKNIYFTQLTKH